MKIALQLSRKEGKENVRENERKDRKIDGQNKHNKNCLL